MKLSQTAVASAVLLLTSLPALAGTLHVPADYSCIQAAVNAAQNGDTIEVASGTYHESVVVDMDHIKIVGTGGPVLDGAAIGSCGPLTGPGITVNASDVSVSGMTIQNYNGPFGSLQLPGIFVNDSCTNANICNNVLQDNGIGLLLIGLSSGDDRSSFQICSNTSTRNMLAGFRIQSTNGTLQVSNNQSLLNGGDGFVLSGANGVNLDHNTAICNGTAIGGGSGITAGLCGNGNRDFPSIHPNTITSNTVAGNHGPGIFLDHCVEQTLKDNSVSGNQGGIWLTSGCVVDSVVHNNVLNNLGVGIFLSGDTFGNDIYQNTAIGNSPYDVEDDMCFTANTWHNNTFVTSFCP